MAKMLYSASVSLDGFIAGPEGDMSWLRDFMGPNPTVDDILSQIGALLIGNRTFHGDDPNKGTESEGAYGGEWNGPQIVLTHNPPTTPDPAYTFVSDLDTAITLSKQAAGDKYVSILGANVARQCLEAGALDEILVCIVPVLLGDGVRLFDYPGGTNIKLEHISQTFGPRETNIWLRVVK